MSAVLLFNLNNLSSGASVGSTVSVTEVATRRVIPPASHYVGNFASWVDLVSRYSYNFIVWELTIDPASVSANSTSEQDFDVPGLNIDDVLVNVSKPSHTSGLTVVNYRISAKDTLAIQFANATGSPIDPPEETYVLVYMKNTAK